MTQFPFLHCRVVPLHHGWAATGSTVACLKASTNCSSADAEILDCD